ncbi:MAG: 3-deoxy-7-phosphoheptulonate synthase [Planctomycetota bacterium]|nr:3-deoxy-7-phosphoheptulonate synthase [Planctomycetota bacterium]
MQPTQYLHIRDTIPLISPNELKVEFPISEEAARTVVESRQILQRIISGEDPRPVAIVGPCSIHNVELGLEYAKWLKTLADEVQDCLFVIMRVYFEKPRTTVGWKGLINDPHLDDTFDINTGLRLARKLLLDINELGLSAATELLEPVTPQYIADLITLGAIGARTTESPTHRQMASGLSMPVGFKNGTDGGLQSALDAMLAARAPHSFLGIDPNGRTCIVNTNGNPWGHLILRGGRSGPNYDSESILSAAERLEAAGLPAKMIVDCSHANSNKDYTKQHVVWNDVIAQQAAGNNSIMGLMLESNLKPGNQDLTDPTSLEHGVSITDGCIGLEETEQLLRNAAETLRD